MKYKVTGVIVCALIVIVVTVFSLSCEKNPVAPEVTSREGPDNLDQEYSPKTREDDIYQPYMLRIKNLAHWNDEVSSIKVYNGKSDGSRIILYKDANYKGKSEVFIANDPNFAGGNYVGNDAVSSVKIIGGARCVLYSNSKFGGQSLTLTTSCSNLKNKVRMKVGPFTINWNDCVSSIKVSNITSRGIVLYQHNYWDEKGSRPGRSQVFFNNRSNLVGTYIGNDCVSYVKAVNCEFDLYRDANYQDELTGRNAKLIGDVYDLSANDNVSAFKAWDRIDSPGDKIYVSVYRDLGCDPKRGYNLYTTEKDILYVSDLYYDDEISSLTTNTWFITLYKHNNSYEGGHPFFTLKKQKKNE
jgi:hypothetical protein